jgi:hypothetical protein
MTDYRRNFVTGWQLLLHRQSGGTASAPADGAHRRIAGRVSGDAAGPSVHDRGDGGPARSSPRGLDNARGRRGFCHALAVDQDGLLAPPGSSDQRQAVRLRQPAWRSANEPEGHSNCTARHEGQGQDQNAPGVRPNATLLAQSRFGAYGQKRTSNGRQARRTRRK